MESNLSNPGVYALPQEQRTWLQTTLEKTKKKVLLFIHCPIDDHDVNGNYFYEEFKEKGTEEFFLENRTSLRNLLSQFSCVGAVIQAHLHYFHARTLKNIPYITCPAMGDNICAPGIQDNFPEIYTILDLSQDRLYVKAFSGKYCFAGADFNV